jgi:hypothetical protein
MEQEKRPGGLTALAVFNFIFAGLGVFGFMGFAALLGLRNVIPTDNMQPDQRAQFEAFQEMGTLFFVAILALMLVSMVLEIISGIGYLKQKRGMGRMVGNVYAIFSMVSGVVSGLVMKPELGGGFNIGAILGFVYPVLTLILLNSTFKEDFTN